MSPEYISEMFQRSDTNYNLRNSDTIIFDKHCIKYLGPYLWRKLPIALRTLTETETEKFKKKIRKSDLAGHLMEDKCGSECTLCSS